MWVIVFALTLVISMGGAYAYFTASTEKKQASATTGIIAVGFSDDTKLVESSTGSYSNIKIVPGSTVSYHGYVKNTGTAAMYAVLECNVTVDSKIVQTQYYTATGTKLSYSDAQKTFTTDATAIAIGGQSAFDILFTFDKTYDNSYKNKTAKLQVVARAIQQSHLTAVQATNQLLSGSMPVDSLPSSYTQLEYVEMTGAQWINTPFYVSGTTDNFIVETALKWTDISKRQLMGYDGGSTGYFGINEVAKYEIGGSVSTISANTTSFDSLQVIRDKTNKIWSMYVNNSLAKTSTVDAKEGIMTIGTFGNLSNYACSAQMKYFKIYQDGAMKYCYIPAKNSSGVAGMYETVNGVWYPSKTSTAFVAGPEVFGTGVTSTYTQLKHITTAGAAYINTGVYPAGVTDFGVEIKYNSSTGSKWLFGSRTAAQNKDNFGLFFNGTTQFWAQVGGNTGSTGGYFTHTVTGTHTIKLTTKDFTYDDTKTTFTTTLTAGTAKYPLVIGTMNNAGSMDDRGFVGNIYYCTIYSGTSVIRNYVPCKNASGVVGMYDTVTGTFYKSGSSTAFTAGPTV